MTYEESMKLTKKLPLGDVLDYAIKAYPDYVNEAKQPKKKMPFVTICPCDSTTLYNMHWEGGSKRQYRLVRLDRLEDSKVDEWNQASKRVASGWPGNNTQEGNKLEMVEGFAIVVHSIFCGKDSGLTFYIHPNDRGIGA